MFGIFTQQSSERQKLIDQYLKLLAKGADMTADDLLETARLRMALGIGERPPVQFDVMALQEVDKRAKAYAEVPKLLKAAEKAQSTFVTKAQTIREKIKALEDELDREQRAMSDATKLARSALDKAGPGAIGVYDGSEAVRLYRRKLADSGKLPGDTAKMPSPPRDVAEVIREAGGEAEPEQSQIKAQFHGNASAIEDRLHDPANIQQTGQWSATNVEGLALGEVRSAS